VVLCTPPSKINSCGVCINLILQKSPSQLKRFRNSSKSKHPLSSDRGWPRAAAPQRGRPMRSSLTIRRHSAASSPSRRPFLLAYPTLYHPFPSTPTTTSTGPSPPEHPTPETFSTHAISPSGSLKVARFRSRLPEEEKGGAFSRSLERLGLAVGAASRSSATWNQLRRTRQCWVVGRQREEPPETAGIGRWRRQAKGDERGCR
jgi:hypothetical protein